MDGAPLKGCKVGFAGIGVMGASMARHLQRAGADLVLHNRSDNPRLTELVAAGGRRAASPRELAEECDVVFTMLGFPSDVEEVYLGADGLLSSARAGAVLVDCTTSSPALAERIHRAAAERGVEALDAPVTGGDVGAREGTLSILVGGGAEPYERVLPFLQRMGKLVVRHGEAGSGQRAKLVNQILVAASMLGVCEAFGFALRLGLDPQKLFESLAGGAAGSWSLNHLAPRMLQGDFAPGFYVKHFIKDLRLALEEAKGLGMETPVVDAALRVYGILADQGKGNLGTQALWTLYAPTR